MHLLALVADSFAHFAHDLCKLLHNVLHKIDLAVVILLNAIEAGAILSFDLVYAFIQLLDRRLVVELVLGRLVLQ